MKKHIILFLGLLLTAFTLQAQQYDVLDQVRQDARKSWGMEGPHRLEQMGPLSKAPKGYKPVYIAHYGRHGSRYAWNSKTYTLIRDVMAKAAEAGVLTPYGESFKAQYEAIYMAPWINAGDLVPMGYDQHMKIGEFVYKSFPKVFKGKKEVSAVSSTAQRCIVSMGAFNLGLKSGNPDLKITLGSTHEGMCIVAPPSAPKSMVRHFKGEDDPQSMEDADAFLQRTFPYKDVLGKLFTDTAFFETLKADQLDFLSELWSLYTGYHNYVSEPLFDDLFTDDQRVQAWEADNYASFYADLTARYSMIPLLEDIIAKANDALKNPNKAADLRFGHDYILEGLVTLLNINGMGTIPATPEEAKYWFRNFDIPMAATLLFVFYQDKKGDTLFKVILNEREATLPTLQPVSGPYYRWSDFLAWTDSMLKAHPEVK